MFKNKSVRNWGIVVVIVAILFGVWTFASAKTNTTTVNTEGKVVSLTTTETIEASGSLEAQPFAALTWKTSGVVEKVNVEVGDLVKAGDILLTLQPSSTSASVVSAQADLVSAQKDLDDLLNSNTDLAQTVIDLKDAKEEYQKADDYLKFLQNSKKVPQTVSKTYLLKTRDGWKYVTKYQSYKGSAPEDWVTEAENDLALKKANMDELQRTYDRLKDGPNAQDVLAAQAKVDAAQATVNSLYIIAPFDGQILSIDSHIGDSVNVDDLSVNIADMDHLYVEAQVDESDVANVKAGQHVEVTLDALTEVALKGKVSVVNPVGETVSGLVKYKVRIDLDKVTGQTFIPLGTTANVVIRIKEASNTLMVPITAIQNDSEGEYVLVIQDDNTTKRVNVVGGAIVGDLVAITGDLKEGDRVQVGQASSGGPFGGGN